MCKSQKKSVRAPRTCGRRSSDEICLLRVSVCWKSLTSYSLVEGSAGHSQYQTWRNATPAQEAVARMLDGRDLSWYMNLLVRLAKFHSVFMHWQLCKTATIIYFYHQGYPATLLKDYICMGASGFKIDTPTYRLIHKLRPPNRSFKNPPIISTSTAIVFANFGL